MSLRSFLATVTAALAAMAGSTAPAHAAYPGANGKIVFENWFFSTPDLHVVDADGSNEVRLTWGGDDRDPVWSPDGAKIAFSRGADGDFEIWVMDADGTDQRRLTQNTAHDWQPTWVRNDQIAFSSLRDFGNREIYLMSADGGSQRSLTGTPSGPSGPYEMEPSAKQGAIAYTREDFEEDIWQLTGDELDTKAPILAGGFDPNWSPDGTRLSFARDIPPAHPGYPDIWVSREDGTLQANVTDTPYPTAERQPAWSPDGELIVYAVDSSFGSTGGYGLSVVDPETKTRRMLVDKERVSELDPDWQPLPGYPRPKGATPLHTSLVPAYSACEAPNAQHGEPLAHGACIPPRQRSGRLTVGTPDANGRAAASVGWVQMRVRAGDPATAADEADVTLTANITDVQWRSDPAAYAGDLRATMSVRSTDRASGAGMTMEDFGLDFDIPCAPVEGTGVGATCSVTTSVDAVVGDPGAIKEASHAIWQLEGIDVHDGGSDGVGSTTADNTLLLTQGIFVP